MFPCLKHVFCLWEDEDNLLLETANKEAAAIFLLSVQNLLRAPTALLEDLEREGGGGAGPDIKGH